MAKNKKTFYSYAKKKHRIKNYLGPVMEGKCNVGNNVYKTKILTDNTKYNYVGVSEQPLRKRIASHQYSFRSENNQTELSAKVKQLDRDGTQYRIEYHVMENTESYKPEIGCYKLCISEKYYIIFGGLENLLNSKLEVTGTCRHRAKFKIGNG